MSYSTKKKRRAVANAAADPEVVVRGVNLTRDWSCHRCGNCCRGPGVVTLTREDEIRIAEFLDIPLSKFRETYCKQEWDGTHILKDHPGSDACIFLQEDNSCRVHPAKPEQCVGYPYKWRDPEFFKLCEGFLAAKKALLEKSNV